MNIAELQHQLFNEIKSKIPPHVSATEEIAKVLDVSVDSTYRRMRGEKTISLEELHKLSTYYNISLDGIMNIQSGAFLFQGRLVDSNTFRFDQYWVNILQQVTYYNSFNQKELYSMNKDIPIFYHFLFRELAAFKYYFWMRTIFHFPDFKTKKFSFNYFPDDLFELGKKCLEMYNRLTVVEFWNIENINSTVRQIEFYRDGQIFESDEDVLKIYIVLEKMIDHLEMQAALGYKFNYDDPGKKPVGSYQMYYNEVIIGDNSYLIVLDGLKLSVVNHSVTNFMFTRDIAFNENMYNHVQNLMMRSTQISKVSEKERSRFFRLLREKIQKRKDALQL
jgi:transcriptional regulator with XRE-family HTH domain